MLVQRDSVSCAASALTTLSAEQDRRKRKVKPELPRPRKVTSAGSGVRGAGVVPPPPSDDVIARLQKPSYQRDFQPLALYGPHGVGCQLPAQDVLTLADGQCLADTVVDFHNMYPKLEGGKTWFALDTKAFTFAIDLNRAWPLGHAPCIFAQDYLAIPVFYEGHYSLVIVTNLRTMVSGKLSETAEGGVELVHYDSAQLHTNKPEVMEGVKRMLLLLHKAQLPTADRKQAEDHVKYAEVYVMHFMTFYGAKSHAYRRQLREEVSLHATGDLIVKLFGEGVDVPVQPLPQVGEHGALVFPKEDEVRTDLARQSGMIARMEIGGYVVCAAVMGLARSLGISEEQLLSGAAHELQAHRTPLLTLSTSKNPVEHAASMRTLGMSIHPAPCPLPQPSVPSAHFEGASPSNGEPTPADVRPKKEKQDLPAAPVTPAPQPMVSRSARYRLRTGQQIRLGAYTVELDAAYAYAAAAFVIRRNDHIQHVKELTDEEKECLVGCVRDDVRHLVKARMWWRWRQWRTALAELGIERGTPFPLENSGTRSPDNSSSDEDVQDRMGHGVETVDGTAASSGKAGRRRKRPVQDVVEGSARVDGEPDAPPAPSSDDDPNVALPRRNLVHAQDEDGAEAENNADSDAEEDDAGARRDPNDAPVTREELQSMRELHEETARAIARLETAFIAKPKDDGSAKKRRRRKRGSGKGKRRKARRARSTSETASDEEGGFDDEDEGHLRHYPSAIMQEALDLLPTDKGWKELCEQARTELFVRRSNAQLTFYPSSAAKTWAICAVVDNLTESYASVALAACKASRVDLNRSCSDWKTAAAGRVRDIGLPKIGLFRHERDMKSPWATKARRTLSRIRNRVGLGDVLVGKLRLFSWSCSREGMPFASGAFTACARAVFKPRMVNGTVTLKLYHVAWLEHVMRSITGRSARVASPTQSASTNAQIVDGLHVLVKAAVRAAIADFRPAYDEASQSWEWGRHGLRISADGIAAVEAVTAEASVSRGTPQA
ncbi:unnamed protein product [Closterium sp. Yama58-4]|nr:unnamed protein product [Closterium sp. Yama58-4]